MKTDQSEWVSRAGKSALVASVLTILLIAYGSWVRVSGSGLGCPDWPLCEGNSEQFWNLTPQAGV